MQSLSRENWSGQNLVRADHISAKVVRGRTTFGSQKVVRVANTDPGVETAHCFVTVGYYVGANDNNTSRVNVVRPWSLLEVGAIIDRDWKRITCTPINSFISVIAEDRLL